MSNVPDLQLYLARTEPTNWSQVPLEQSSRSLQTFSSHDFSPGRDGDAGNFVWIDPRTAEVVDGGCAKRRFAQSYGSGPRSMEETVASKFKIKVKRRHCDETFQISSFCTAMSVVDVIVIDDSKNSKAAPAVYALENTVDMDDGTPSPVLPKSMDIDVAGRADFGDASPENLQDST